MKVFREEYGVEKVYVQRLDLAMIKELEPMVPSVIVRKRLENVEEEQRYEFVSFDDPLLVSFFKKLNWILDYDDFESYDVEMLCEKKKQLKMRIEHLTSIWNTMSAEEQTRSNLWRGELGPKIYIKDTIDTLIKIKQGSLSISVPNHTIVDTTFFGTLAYQLRDLR